MQDDLERLRTECARGEAVRAGATEPVTPSIVTATTFAFPDQAAVDRYYEQGEGHLYSRCGNPTVEATERLLARLEGTEGSVLFASGMAAISTTVLAHAGEGAIAAQNGLYGGTEELLGNWLPRLGAEARRFSLDDLKKLKPSDLQGCALLYLESPTNPMLRLVDLSAVSAVAHEAGVPVACDSTFAPPTVQRAASLGVDFVIHSVTKYLAGHSDVTGGAVSGGAAALEKIRAGRTILGGAMEPFGAFHLERGMRTLAVRMPAHQAGAMAIAEALDAHPQVASVHYPGLADHPEHELALRQQSGFGGMLSFRVIGGEPAARRVHDRLRIFVKASSLGGTESLVSLPCGMSHRKLNAEQRRATGLDESTVRLSVGLESAEALIADLKQAL